MLGFCFRQQSFKGYYLAFLVLFISSGRPSFPFDIILLHHEKLFSISQNSSILTDELSQLQLFENDLFPFIFEKHFADTEF